jgi:hypothetical protein
VKGTQIYACKEKEKKKTPKVKYLWKIEVALAPSPDRRSRIYRRLFGI